MMIEHHWSNEQGMPTGGVTSGCGFTISWQNGPLGRGEERLEPNGAFVEDVIKAALGRLEYYQRSPFACQENANAVESLKDALRFLEDRTRRREDRQAEGTHQL